MSRNSFSLRIPRRVSRRLSLAGLAALAVVALGASGGQAADPFLAGQRSTRGVAATSLQAARALDRGRLLLTALGVRAARHETQRLEDRFDHRVVDEVTSFDATGRAVAVSQFDLDGSVAMSAALGWRQVNGPRADSAGALQRALRYARSAGIVPDGRPDVRSSAGAGGWSVSWPRFVDGVPVRGDGVRILLFADGSFHGLTRTERPLAAAPAVRLTRDAARAAAEQSVASRAGTKADDLRFAAVDLAWVAPTRSSSGVVLDAPDATLRLAWVVRFDASPALVERLRAAEMWLDAGDGHELGGDVIE
ncbi:MAG TPA: hypothetical protein VGO64_00215 [Candidatus Limnocylindrales bacterium]|nr:hypothetical protein [Candidatus Limnocylindrales bacterium]